MAPPPHVCPPAPQSAPRLCRPTPPPSWRRGPAAGTPPASTGLAACRTRCACSGIGSAGSAVAQRLTPQKTRLSIRMPDCASTPPLPHTQVLCVLKGNTQCSLTLFPPKGAKCMVFARNIWTTVRQWRGFCLMLAGVGSAGACCWAQQRSEGLRQTVGRQVLALPHATQATHNPLPSARRHRGRSRQDQRHVRGDPRRQVFLLACQVQLPPEGHGWVGRAQGCV